MPRLKLLIPSELSPEQKLTYDALTSGPRGANMKSDTGSLGGPFNAMLHAPNIGIALQELGARLRFGTSVPRNLLELAIITIGAHWEAQYEFWAHARMAIEAGVEPHVVESIRNGDEPVLTGDEQTVYIFCAQVIHEYRASDDAYESAIALLGEQGVMEITTLIGYYSAISFVLNVFEIPVPDGEIAPFQRD